MAKNEEEGDPGYQAMAVEIEKMLESAKTTAGQIASLSSESKTRCEEIAAATSEATAARTKLTDLQTVVATKSDHIEDARLHADKVRADLDAQLTQATNHATEATAA